MNTPYRGRFAPSPTGALHFGSLVAAVGSYLEARTHHGEWRVRMEDLDIPRVQKGADADIPRTLEIYGLHWDGAVEYQSKRHALYAHALQTLQIRGWVYPCACSRREIADSALSGPEGLIYPGTCRRGLPHGRNARAFRVKTQGEIIRYRDVLQGKIEQDLEHETGDFILLRADSIYAYQLAVVVDDAKQGITHVVRGADLLHSTARQIHLQHLLELPTLHYAHLPVVVNTQGEKLSKQTQALPVDRKNPARVLTHALAFLGQDPPSDLPKASVSDLWEWAFAHWALDKVPQARALPLPTARPG